ncbi:MAG: hypothetical protein BMS9Abin02_1844 [Anaerolineae bacterium]|nr:MAG: hypothetical protein BMS9Abin02_1844 [Anaerolineae bacterium]
MNENDDIRRIMLILIREIFVNLCPIFRGADKSMVMTDLLNSLIALFMIVVGVLLLRDGLGNGQLPFLLIGLLLIIIGLFRIGYSLLKGKWFRFFGRGDIDA